MYISRVFTRPSLQCPQVSDPKRRNNYLLQSSAFDTPSSEVKSAASSYCNTCFLGYVVLEGAPGLSRIIDLCSLHEIAFFALWSLFAWDRSINYMKQLAYVTRRHWKLSAKTFLPLEYTPFAQSPALAFMWSLLSCKKDDMHSWSERTVLP